MEEGGTRFDEEGGTLSDEGRVTLRSRSFRGGTNLVLRGRAGGPGFGAAQPGVSAPRHTPEKSGAAQQ